LVPRKRFRDVVAAFGRARLGDRAVLHLRLLESAVRSPTADARVMAAIETAQRLLALDGALRIDRAPTGRADYRDYDLYVCASSYEGFSMTPIEAAYSGCPPLMSDIPAHRAIASTLFGEHAERHLYPAGDTDALALLLRDEVETGERGADVRLRLSMIRGLVESRWSTRQTAEALLEATL
jgi:glycosyltransferase involved in cell wall biosynthesis